MFAGSLQGVTQTLPLAVYTTFEAQNGLDVALAISALLVVISLAILLTLKGSGLWERSRPAVTAIAQPEPR
jgi:ABC-type sulfate transport system, permease component